MSIRFEQVTKAFGSRKVLDGISFEIAKGEILFILGKSGMGKSVTLKHTIGLLQPDSGQVWVDDQNVASADPQQLAQIRQKCGMVFQHPALLDSLSVYNNIAFGLRTPQFRLRTGRTLSDAEEREIVLKLLRSVHLEEEILPLFPREISYGMQKRVSMARTLAPGPHTLLFDEPTTGLDPLTTNAVNQLIFELSRELQVTSVVVSHDMACALKIADRILVLDEGKVLQLGTVRELIRHPKPLVQDFLSETLALLSPEERSRLEQA